MELEFIRVYAQKDQVVLRQRKLRDLGLHRHSLRNLLIDLWFFRG